MKKTFILAHGRTGSSFLSDHFKTIHNYSFSCGEMFNHYIPYHFTVMKWVFADHNLPIPNSHHKFLLRLGNSVQYSIRKESQQKPWRDYPLSYGHVSQYCKHYKGSRIQTFYQ